MNKKKDKKTTTFREKMSSYGDKWLISLKGIKKALSSWKFVVSIILIALFFGTLMHLLSTGLGAVQILFSPAAIEYKFNSILAPAFLANFGVNMNFIDWLPIFLIAIIQGFLISLLIFTAKIRKESRELSKKNKGAKIPRSSESGKTSAIAAGLAVLGTGCPTCGTSLLVPILGAAFAGSSAVIGAISGVLMFIAILIALLSLQKVAEEYYVLSVMVKKLRQSKTKTDEASSQ